MDHTPGSILAWISSNWVLIYLGLEMQTFLILILLGRARGAYGLEGGLKYFIFSKWGIFRLFIIRAGIFIQPKWRSTFGGTDVSRVKVRVGVCVLW